MGCMSRDMGGDDGSAMGLCIADLGWVDIVDRTFVFGGGLYD